MNEKMQAILLKIVVELKKQKWVAEGDWRITLKSEGHVSLIKQIPVRLELEADEWSNQITTNINLKLQSQDEITFFPEYIIYASLFVEGGQNKDLSYKLDADVAFTEKDVKDEGKAKSAAAKINRLVEDYIEDAYDEYINQHYTEIKAYNAGGWKEDEKD